MWICMTCTEELEDTQSECWSCGTHRDGEKNPDFDRVLWERDADSDHIRIVRSWACPNCPGPDFSLIDDPVSQGSMLPGRGSVWFTIVTCEQCGFSERVQRTSPLPPGGAGVRVTGGRPSST